MLALAGIAAMFCRWRDDPAAANPAIPLLNLRWTFPAKRASVVVTDSEPARLAPLPRQRPWPGSTRGGLSPQHALATQQRREIGNRLYDCAGVKAQFLGNFGGATLNPERVQSGGCGAIDVPRVRRDEPELGGVTFMRLQAPGIGRDPV